MGKTAIVVAFAGDSGDGMQIVGQKLAESSAFGGNDVHTYPDFPAEIRAPAGTLAGVSGFQVAFADHDIRTSGDSINVLVAMNPASLISMAHRLTPGATLFIDEHKFTPAECAAVGFTDVPEASTPWRGHTVISVPMTELTLTATENSTLSRSKKRRCKNFFALGIIMYMFARPTEPLVKWLQHKFSADVEQADANVATFYAGMSWAQAAEPVEPFLVERCTSFEPGVWRHIRGNEAFVLAMLYCAKTSQRPVFLSGYPITPASDILHAAAPNTPYGITVFQAEDEMAAAGAALGAAYGGASAITCTSGPGMDLKAETIGLAVMAELPMVIIDVQRGGPSTGMPTKPEQADLNLALYGRHGECPLPVLAAASPGDCFHTLIEALQIAQSAMTPVIVLSDASLAGCSEPWRVPQDAAYTLPHKDAAQKPFDRDAHLSRGWVVPGTPEGEHRIGGLEKDFLTGNISYNPDNHQKMIHTRAQKIQNVAQHYPPSETYGPDSGDVLVISWGSTQGVVFSTIDVLRAQGHKISALHLRHLNPLPNDMLPILKRFARIVVVEMNTGHLLARIRSEFLIDAKGIHKVSGVPFKIVELTEQLHTFLGAAREKSL